MRGRSISFPYSQIPTPQPPAHCQSLTRKQATMYHVTYTARDLTGFPKKKSLPPLFTSFLASWHGGAHPGLASIPQATEYDSAVRVRVHICNAMCEHPRGSTKAHSLFSVSHIAVSLTSCLNVQFHVLSPTFWEEAQSSRVTS